MTTASWSIKERGLKNDKQRPEQGRMGEDAVSPYVFGSWKDALAASRKGRATEAFLSVISCIRPREDAKNEI